MTSEPTADEGVVEAPAHRGRAGLFRAEAVLDHAKVDRTGAPLRIAPWWAGVTYWVLLAVFVCGLGFVVVARQREYASGPALVRLVGYDQITALTPGVVATIEVTHGQHVQATQVLVRFEARAEQDVLDRTQNEYDLELARWLWDLDTPSHTSLVRLASEMKLAHARVEQRLVRAPYDGTVSDVRIRPGQSLQAGEPVVGLLSPGASRELVAFVPAEYRPQLRVGQPLRLRLRGYERTSVALVLTSIADEAIGPGEARRFLGFELADAIPLVGPVVVVRAALPSPTFSASGQSHAYFPGMLGEADIAVRDERLVFRLLPGLRRSPS